LLPTTQDRCEFYELGAHSRPFRLRKLALNTLFDGGTGGSLELRLTVGAIYADLHRLERREQDYLLLPSDYARHVIVSGRFVARRTVAATGEPLIDPAHVDAAPASYRN
jgi:hypothetical protein